MFVTVMLEPWFAGLLEITAEKLKEAIAAEEISRESARQAFSETYTAGTSLGVRVS